MDAFKITVKSPALMTGVTAEINNKAVTMSTQTRRKYESDEMKAAPDADGKIEVDVHVRGRKDAGVTIIVENVTLDCELFKLEKTIGSQPSEGSTRYELRDKKITAQCPED